MDARTDLFLSVEVVVDLTGQAAESRREVDVFRDAGR
jgi:hypothetical protein